MNDDLTWLARNVHKWPDHILDTWYAWKDANDCASFGVRPPMTATAYTREEWAARRAELQNKPSWDDAPEWATHLAQDGDDGSWFWYGNTPEKSHTKTHWCEQTGSMDMVGTGEVLGDWRDTLEARTQDESNYHKAMRAIEDGLPDVDLAVHLLKSKRIIKEIDGGKAKSVLRGVPPEPIRAKWARAAVRHLVLKGVLDVDLRNVPCDCGRVDPAGCKCSEPSNVGVATPEEDEEATRMPPSVAEHQAGKSDGSTASYYELPEGATELQHLISHRNLNAQDGEIFRAIYRKGLCSHSSPLREAKKVLFYAQAEVERLEALSGSE